MRIIILSYLKEYAVDNKAIGCDRHADKETVFKDNSEKCE